MTTSAIVTDESAHAAVDDNEEARVARVFYVVVALVLVSYAIAGSLFGMGGVSAVAMVEAALMLAACVFLTRG